MGVNRHLSAIVHSDPSLREWTKGRKFNPVERYGPNVDLDHVEVCDDDSWIHVACDTDDPCEVEDR
jgi:hypothetical protein